jgi:hypothetical protein
MERFLNVLYFLRLTDEQHRLSLTNIVVVATLVMTAMRPEVGTIDLLTFVASIVGYQIKRFAPVPEAETDEDLKNAVKELQTKMSALHIQPRR